MGKFLIKNADIANFDDLSTSTKDILIEDGKFKKIADKIERSEHPDATTIDAHNMLALPGFVDCHSHVYQTFIKGALDDAKEKYEAETDFRQKIALKKQIEAIEAEQRKMIESFHEEMTELEKQAEQMQEKFEENIISTIDYSNKKINRKYKTLRIEWIIIYSII